VHIAAIVRQEFFYQLRILGEHVPAPGDVYEMPEIDFDAQSGDAVVVARRLKQIAGAAVARSVTAGTLAHEARGQSDQLHGRILPLEMQVAGEALERLFRKSHEYEVDERQYRRIGGTRDSLIREYFDYYIGQSSDRELAPSVLYALTVAPPPHHLTIEEIARAAYALPERVEAVLRDFTAAGLLRTTESGYQWTHESLAAMYADTAPSDLLAAAREAVRYHVQHRTTGFDARTSHAPALIALSHAVVALMVSSILGWGLLNAERAFVPGTYLFAIPAHVGWAFFVYRFALAFVVRLRRGAVVAWLFVALMGAASLVVTMKWPETWIGSMGLTGAAIGLTLLFATAWPRRAPLIRRPVRAEGWKFIIVGFLMIVAGIGYAALARDGAYPVPLTYAGAGLTIALAVLAASATHRHATAAAGAVWLSYVERP
jgi:uncharacterized protein with HEPN domain